MWLGLNWWVKFEKEDKECCFICVRKNPHTVPYYTKQIFVLWFSVKINWWDSILSDLNNLTFFSVEKSAYSPFSQTPNGFSTCIFFPTHLIHVHQFWSNSMVIVKFTTKKKKKKQLEIASSSDVQLPYPVFSLYDDLSDWLVNGCYAAIHSGRKTRSCPFQVSMLSRSQSSCLWYVLYIKHHLVISVQAFTLKFKTVP